MELVADPAPAEGATTLSITADYLDAESPMAIDPDAGDTAFLTHNTGRTTAAGVPYQALGAIAYLEPFALGTAGGATSVRGAFEALPQDRTRTLDWRVLEYRTLLQGAVPEGTTSFSNTFVSYADVDSRARYSLPVLFRMKALSNADLTGEVRYGNPFPAAWQEYARISLFGFKSHTIDGRTGTSAASAGIVGLADDILGAPVRPTMSPVQDLRVDGKPADGDLAGLSLRPTLTWSPPSLGAPTSYFVQVLKLVPDGTRLTRVTTARLLTASSSITLPPGALTPGEPHYLLVRAQSHPGVSLDRISYEPSYPHVWADRITTLFTP